jgi:hypothetical protein
VNGKELEIGSFFYLTDMFRRAPFECYYGHLSYEKDVNRKELISRAVVLLFIYSNKGNGLKRSEKMSRLRRNSSRNKTKKRNVVLFSALGAVLIGLLFLPKDALLMGNDDKTETHQVKEPKHSIVKLQPDGTTKEEKSSDSVDKQKKDSESDDSSNNSGIDQNKEAEKKQKAEEAQKAEDAQKAEEARKAAEAKKAADAKKAAEAKKKQQAAAGQSTINKPIGTSQTGPHTSSYEEGSVDWNEKLKAIRLATGLDENMTVWKIANGGSPQKSVAEVSPDGKSDQRYTVNLEWVDKKGWKVTNVQK